jgi:hypothetical protein
VPVKLATVHQTQAIRHGRVALFELRTIVRVPLLSNNRLVPWAITESAGITRRAASSVRLLTAPAGTLYFNYDKRPRRAHAKTNSHRDVAC